MHKKLVLLATAALLSGFGFSGTVHAQNNTGYTGYTYTGTGTGYAPIYNGQTRSSSTTGNTVYNSGNVKTLPMQQMIAGKNAPSYNYNQNVNPYGFGAGTTSGSIGVMTPEQASMQRAQRDAQAQAYQQQYLQSLQQQRMQQNGMVPTGLEGYQNGQYGGQQYYGNNMYQQQAPKKKKVIYKQMNNPLTEPSKLFNSQ
ncbi:MAG: hypothetical protein DI551_07920 [Micavibrio aeruginosavorus]|uniref:Uncharacterized protein n=1 Tax=Micavibrio aeruginosavorus TaxID=349221 RepID=A0A2W5PS34_9BACT|nr:MAG: hypothetical protein DI551_07920 [Micavibrio aeruginosavorus]